MMMLKKSAYALGAICLLLSLWGFYDRLVHGHLNAGYGSYVVWGLWVAMYLFFAGTSAGAFMVATLDLLFKVKIFRKTGPIALWIALVSLPAGLLLIGLDLGHMERIWKVYFQGHILTSVMAQMVWGYTLFGILTAVCLYFALKKPESKALPYLMGVGLVLSIFVSGAVGALLGVLSSKAFWHTSLLPVQFPVMALASGVAAVLLGLGLFGPRHDPHRAAQLKWLSHITVVLILIKIYVFWAFFSQSLYGNITSATLPIRDLLFGSHWGAFWILQIGIGMLIPLLVHLVPRYASNGIWAGSMGFLALVGIAMARMNVVFPALLVPDFQGSLGAFYDHHLLLSYFPSLMEWSVMLGAIGIAILAFVIGLDYLPLSEKEVP